jgi:copper chaperone CopZ
MRHLTLFVEGMRCRRCVREVTARLRDVPGVETVVADSRSSVARVSGTMVLEDVLSAFSELTYVAELAEDHSADCDRHSGDSAGTGRGQAGP